LPGGQLNGILADTCYIQLASDQKTRYESLTAAAPHQHSLLPTLPGDTQQGLRKQ
jgi:hypothetical protein